MLLRQALAEVRQETPVVVRWMPALGRWYVCHAGTYQNAIGSNVNGTATRVEGVALAHSFGFDVAFHPRDQLQGARP
jgi:hypothetical protein